MKRNRNYLFIGLRSGPEARCYHHEGGWLSQRWSIFPWCFNPSQFNQPHTRFRCCLRDQLSGPEARCYHHEGGWLSQRWSIFPWCFNPSQFNQPHTRFRCCLRDQLSSITLSFCPDNRSPSLLVSPRDNKDIGPLNETKDMSSKL